MYNLIGNIIVIKSGIIVPKTDSRIDVECKQCGKLCKKYPYEISNNKNLFCSHECYSSYGRVIVKCDCCGKNYEQPRHQAEKTELSGSKYFCSKQCRLTKPNTKTEINCSHCNVPMLRDRYDFKHLDNMYCSRKCRDLHNTAKTMVCCAECGQQTLKKRCHIEKSKTKKFFCGSSCAGTYNSRIKKTGYIRSKLEIETEGVLKARYPDLEILFNNRSLIKKELDIYIPSLAVAIEINGTGHYEPIYGDEKLKRTLDNDSIKKECCEKIGVKLFVVSTLGQVYVTSKTNYPYIQQMIDIIESEISNVAKNANN